MSKSTVACFSDLEVVKASLLGQGRGKRWEKVWGVLWKDGDRWCMSLWGKKQQWKSGAKPIASTQLAGIKKFTTTTVTGKNNVLRLQLVDGGEWVLACASSSVLGKWSDTLQDKLMLQLQGGQTQRQTAPHRDTKHFISGWTSDSDEESPRLEEELRLVLLACPQHQTLPGDYSVLIKENQLQVLQVGGARQWWWAWSDVVWYCLGRDLSKWEMQWQLEMKITKSCTPGGCTFTWAGPSLKRFYSLLCEFAPNAKVLSKNRGISVADDTLTEEQLHSLIQELFLVEQSGEAVGGGQGQYWLTLTGDQLSLLDHVSKEMVWAWSLTEVQEFTLESLRNQKRLVIKVGSGAAQAEYCLSGERIAMVFVALKELMRQMEAKHLEAAPEEYEGGVRMVISPTVRQGMKAVYHLTLTAAPEESSHLMGRYQVTVSCNSLHLVSDQVGEGWSWQLEHIRRFSVQEKDSQLVIETGRRACTGEGKFVFCGAKLRPLCLVLKELTALLCLVTRVRRTLVQIRERIVLRLKTAAPHEIIESFPVTVCASGHSTSPPLGQFTFQIFCNELQFVSMSGKMVSHWAVENLNPVAMETDGESGVPQIILSGSSHGLRTCTLQSKEVLQLYSVLELLREHHEQANTFVPASSPNAAPPPGHHPNVAPPPGHHPNAAPPPGHHPNAAPPPGHHPNAAPPPGHHPIAAPPPGHHPSAAPPPGHHPNAVPPSGQPASHPKPDGIHIIHHVKDAHGRSVCQENCQMVLEDAAIKLLRLCDPTPVWSVELCHLQGATVEGYPDGKGVLLIQTLQGSPHDGMQYLLLCQQPEKVFDSVLRHAEEHKGKGFVHEQILDSVRDSTVVEDTTGPSAEEEEDAMQSDSETVVCCSSWGEHTVSESVNGIPWSVWTSGHGSVADGLTALSTEYSLTLSTSAVPPSALSLMAGEPGTCPAPTDLAVPAVTAASSATSVISEMSDEVFYSDTDQLPAPSSLNLALFRPPRSITPSPRGSGDDSVFALYSNHDDEASYQMPSLLQSLTRVSEEGDDSEVTARGTPEGYERLWEVQEVRITFSEHSLYSTATRCTWRVWIVTASEQQDEEYWLHECSAVEEGLGPQVTQTWSVECPSSIGVEPEGGLGTAPHSVKQPARVSTPVRAPLEFVKGAWPCHLAYWTEVLWVWFGEQQSLPLKQQQQKQQQEEEEELCFRLQWQDSPVVTCQAQVVVA